MKNHQSNINGPVLRIKNLFILFLALTFISGCSTAKNIEDSENKAYLSAPSWAPEAEIHFAEVEGEMIRYLEVGQGEPLVLVHTIRTQLDYFKKLIPELSKHYRVYALDLPGHGYSDINDQPHDKPLFVKTVSGLIKQLNLKNPTLVGESIGGAIVLSVAADEAINPKRVISLNPADYEKSNGLDRSSGLGKVLFTGIRLPLIGWVISNAESRDGLQKILEGGFYDNNNLPPELVTEFSNIGDRPGYSKAFRSIFLNWDSWVEGTNDYAYITAPVTLVYGEQDWSLPEERIANKDRIKSAKLITLDKAGHFSSLDQTEEVLKIILDN
jgi:pimeloyl-ACP methyl ester carboxylesterase